MDAKSFRMHDMRQVRSTCGYVVILSLVVPSLLALGDHWINRTPMKVADDLLLAGIGLLCAGMFYVHRYYGKILISDSGVETTGWYRLLWDEVKSVNIVKVSSRPERVTTSIAFHGIYDFKVSPTPEDAAQITTLLQQYIPDKISIREK
jgi:hypothetical protein